MEVKRVIKIKRCPFCGKEPTTKKVLGIQDVVKCINIYCQQSDWLYLKEWNTRPIENYLKKKLKEGLK